MGDAVGDGGGRVDDPDQTIDAAGEANPTPGPPQGAIAGQDYTELREVDRQHYVVEGEIAKGGMGRVLAARDRRLGRELAIKELLPRHRYAARRFEREARLTARLQHPAIIHVYEAGTWPGGEPFYAMPKIAGGQSLDRVVATCTTLNERLGLLPHVIAVSDALAYAHSQRVIHRDLKPSNVLIGNFGETVVIDWGLAKDLGAPDEPGEPVESVVGTPAYMPPEQARGESVDERADVYALGALLYKLLVGQAPYTGPSSNDVLEQVTKRPPPPVTELEPEAPRELAAIAAKAMARDPKDRYASAGEVAAELKRFQTGQLVAAHRYTTLQLIGRWLRRHVLTVLVAAIAVVAIAIIAVVSVQKIVTEKARAEERREQLLVEQGRGEWLDGNPGKALAYLLASLGDGKPNGLRTQLIMMARRSFDLARTVVPAGPHIAVSADGKHVAAGSGATVIVTDLDGHREPGPQLAAGAEVRALAWDPSGTRLAGGGAGAWVWTRDHGMVALDVGSAAINDIEFDPTGNKVVTGSVDGVAAVWNASTGDRQATAKCRSGAIQTVRFSSKGDRVVTANEDSTACVWTAATGSVVRVLEGHTGPVEMAIWAHDDQWVVTASADGTAGVWDAEMGKLVTAPFHHEERSAVRVVALSHDGRHLLTAGTDHVARVWSMPRDANDTSAQRSVVLSGQTEVVSAAFSNDDARIATGGLDRRAAIWDAETGARLVTLEHDDQVVEVAFADGDQRLVTGSRDGRTMIWNAQPELKHYEVDSTVNALAVSRDGVAAAATNDSNVRLIDDSGATPLYGHVGRVLAVAFAADGKTLISAGEDPRPIVWDVATHAAVRELGVHDHPIQALATARDGRIATAAGDTVRVFAADGELQATLRDSAATITALAFAPGDEFVVAGTDDGAIVAWPAAANAAPPLLVHKLSTAIRSIAVGHDGSLAIIAASRVAIYPRFGAPVALDNPGEVYGAQFSADASLVITAGEDGAKVWDAASGRLLDTADTRGHSLRALALGPGRAWVSTDKGLITSWELRSLDLSAEALEKLREKDPWFLDENDVLQRRPDR